MSGIITIMLAIKSDDGLVVDDYYKQGLEINRKLERDQRAKELGLRVAIQYGKELSTVRVLLNANPDFQYPPSLQVSFLNASRNNLDRKLEFSRYVDNIYTASNPGLVKGKWHVQVEQEDWRVLEVLQVP